MNETDDVIVGVTANYEWAQLQAYAVSMATCGFKGKKLLFVQNITADARLNLATLGFDVRDFTVKFPTGSFFTDRFEPVLDYLKEFGERHRFVIWTDIRDVVFQANPSDYLETLGLERLVVCSEGVPLKHEPTNMEWLRIVLRTSPSADLQEQDQLCSGTIAGYAGAMYDFLAEITRHSYDVGGDLIAGRDQALLNYLARTVPYVNHTRVSKADEPFALQANWFMIKRYEGLMTTPSPILDLEKGLAYTHKGELYAILHQYDRDARGWLGDFKSAVERRYVMDSNGTPNPAISLYRPLTKR